MTLLLAGIALVLGGGLAAPLAGRRSRAATALALAGMLPGSVLGVIAAASALATGGDTTLRVPSTLPFGPLSLRLDPVAAFFLLVLFAIAPLAAIYGAGYLAEAGRHRRLGGAWCFTALLVAGMAVTLIAADAVLFLIAWEVMSLAAYFLVTFDDERAAEVVRRLDAAMRDVREAVELMFNAPSVQGRFEGTGALTRAQAVEIGLVGVAARACGLELDSRLDFPSGIYRFAQVPVSSWDSGDVFARAWVRWLEVQRSAAFVREQLASLPPGEARVAAGPLAADSLAVAIVAGWRGEVCHVAVTGNDGRLARYKVVDPSFHNWFGLALALRGQAISDFPLCNKSFNLSYCGHDL